ncbi:MAG: Rieske 2Fe-2S domain-containing protein, partial [Pigmentiphaga sp.]
MSTTSPRYRSDPSAIRALVQPDRVHRDVYLSQEIFELEQEHLFRNTWNYVGHESQIPNDGDYLTTELAGRPLVLVRQADNSIKTLMNRCPHKGARVVSGASGNIGRFFRCPYHAWTFKPSGE